ncbi:acetyl esterase [Alkalihalobacillus alcalophilus ATCC 27647 = CGMCC 1.3604]|uniref:Acetyl esterase n=1 Tax=Alkalihalobacillus alcalophilus ATCC 27647 = CGMCC 1.3604 TaxID=1218173 RepID=A0A094XCL7_ALKAL|nr:alpha/beta fold hydrolase [Alkalihalobacillus alcalophilus]KGA96545.1 acetyl esterase [Alkalihalobacillus alcalophilus ATCC 27647 = CGMCC 1.3604]MED1564148.1 alpha/beta fold hydrolase [Alkalihalobacillus alcalophilus]THG91841.1 acetyl esterase [Alkalihalobacillus alcalophilus ATCC 27647 = CGMCC 1.3604]
MPLIDMPLEKLKIYRGTNPKPVDFDQYWDRALVEMNSLSKEYVLIKSEFQTKTVECYHLYFTGISGAKIHVKFMKPKIASFKHAAVIKFHGYTGQSGDWTGLLSLASLGHSVFAMDVRGQAGLSEDVGGVRGNTHHGHIIRGLEEEDPNKLFFRDVFLDAAQLLAIVRQMDHIDESRIATTGWSQGGALALACAALVPDVKKVATVYPFLSDYKRVWEMDLTVGAYRELRSYFRFFDPEHKKEEKVFEKLGYIDVQHLAERIKAEVHIGVGLMDSICPPSTQYAIYNKIQSEKQIYIYPDFEHEDLPGHSDKIHQFLEQL